MVSKLIDRLAERAYGVFLNNTPTWSVFHHPGHGHGGELRWADLAPQEKEIFRAMARCIITGSVRAAKEVKHHAA
jgi:hypothetical protein